MTRIGATSLIGAVCAFAAISCGIGGLEQAELSGECAGSAGCGTSLDDGPLAVGASVELRVRSTTPGAGTPALELSSPAADVIEVRGTEIHGVGPGMSAVLLLDSAGSVLDFFHVFVELPDHLYVTRVAGDAGGADLDGGVELLVGDELTLTSRPSKDSQLLAGSAAAEWSSDSEAITILLDGDPSRRRLVARTPGPAEISVTSMGLSRTFVVNVLP